VRLSPVVLAAFIAVSLSDTARAQALSGPILGFVPDSTGTSLLPVKGVPGASILGNSIDFNGSLSSLAVAPTQEYALALRQEDSKVVLIDLRSATPSLRPIYGMRSVVIGISPSATAAALYDPSSGALEILGGLPEEPAIVRGINVSGIAGPISSAAVSDDGTVTLLKSGNGMWAVDSAGTTWQVPASQPSAAAFFPNRRDAVITDNATHSAFLLMDIGHSNTLTLLTWAGEEETLTGASASQDGGRVFLAGSAGNITVVDIRSRATVKTSCDCEPSGLNRLSGSSVFRLTEPSNEPMMVLDASSPQPRIVLIPPHRAQ